MEKVEVLKDDLLELFFLLEKLNAFFHQEENFSRENMQAFATQNYSAIHKAYYQTLWNMLPQEARNRILEKS